MSVAARRGRKSKHDIKRYRGQGGRASGLGCSCLQTCSERESHVLQGRQYLCRSEGSLRIRSSNTELFRSLSEDRVHGRREVRQDAGRLRTDEETRRVPRHTRYGSGGCRDPPQGSRHG